MNKQQYEDMRSRAQDLIYKFQDICDNSDNSVAQGIERELRSLEDDFQTYKNPRSIEDRVKRLEQEFHHMNDPEVMNVEHSRYFAEIFKDMKMHLRSFDNY